MLSINKEGTVIYIIRGLPGSGKSTLARALVSSSVYSADDFFTQNGVYRYDPSQVQHAHDNCLSRVAQEVRRWNGQDGSLAVANTFSQRWEMEPYLKLAQDNGIRVMVMDLFDAGLTDAQLAERCIHGVPEAVIAKMRARWEHAWSQGSPVRVDTRSKIVDPLNQCVVGGYYRAERSDRGRAFAFTLRGHPVVGVVAWGFSIYQGEKGYRTLGMSFKDWLARPGNASIEIYPDRDRRKDV
jgi:predicted kinase